jgi:hypothetical protein
MGVSATVEVFGVRDALKELGQIDKKQRFKAISKVKAAGAPLARAAAEKYPSDPVLVNEAGNVSWSKKGRLGYSKAAADKGVQIVVGGRSFGEAYAIVTIVQKNPGAAMFDIAGFADGKWADGPSGDAFIDVLNRKYGRAQRGMWRNIGVIRKIGNDAIMEALADVTAEVNRKLVA